MAKFDYKKWVTENKHGKSYLTEQTGSGGGTGSGQICANFIATSCTNSNQNWHGYCKTVDGSTPVVGQIIPNTSGDYHTIHTVNPPNPNQTLSADYTSVTSCTGNTTGSGGGTGSADWWCTGTGTAGPSCIQANYPPAGSTGPHQDQATCQAACTTPPTGSGCDNSPNSPCAQQWFGSYSNSFANFMSNKECTGTHTYQGVINRLIPKMTALWNSAPNAIPWSSPQNWNEISQIATAAFGTGPAGAAAGRPKFKRVLAKLAWAICMNSSGCCSGTVNESFAKYTVGPPENLNENKGGGCGCSKPKPPKK
jgi:hypothetical protein